MSLRQTREGWNCRIKKTHPARKVGTSRQRGPRAPGGFDFPGAPNPRMYCISRFGNIFPAIFPALSRSFLQEPPNRPGNSHSLLDFSESRNNRKGGTTSLRSRTCVKRNAVFGARFKGLSLHFLYQKGNLICIKMGLDTYLIRIQTRNPLSRHPPCNYSK